MDVHPAHLRERGDVGRSGIDGDGREAAPRGCRSPVPLPLPLAVPLPVPLPEGELVEHLLGGLACLDVSAPPHTRRISRRAKGRRTSLSCSVRNRLALLAVARGSIFASTLIGGLGGVGWLWCEEKSKGA